MRKVTDQHSEEKFECLPPLAWLFLAVAIAPHLLKLAGQEYMASIASCACFPVTMGPFALVHTYLLVNRLGFLSHMAWISALLFSMTWFALLCWSWRKNRTITIAIYTLFIIVTLEWIWTGILPLA
jgi:hypothetical protein